MSVGIDFGNQYSVAAVVSKGKVDIVTNESSFRKTPTIVGYPDGNMIPDRQLGEKGLTSQKRNAKRTVAEIKRFLGRQFSDPQVQADLKNLTFKADASANGGVHIVVNTKDGEHKLAPEQITGAFLAHLRTMVGKHTGSLLTDVVISCPPYFTHVERQALLDAGRIAGLSVLRVMNETTAIALCYGILRQLPKDQLIKVMFIDVGHASTNASLVAFQQGELQVLGTASDRSLGGRDYDLALTNHFIKEFNDKKLGVNWSAKAVLRLRGEMQKLKHVLSANKEGTFHVDYIDGEVDVKGIMKRDIFNASTQEVTDRVLGPVQQVLAETQTSIADVHSIEIVGGGVRVPAIREKLSGFFNKSLSTTLNGDEAVARGCALHCAMLSPAFRVRPFQVKDVTPYPIELCWGPVTDDYKEATCQFEDKTQLFSKFNLIPSVKMITLKKTEPFQMVLRYLDDSKIPGSTFISRYVITPPPVPADALSPPRIKVQIELSLHGLVGIKSVKLWEEIKPEPEAAPAATDAAGKEAKTDAAPMEDDASTPKGDKSADSPAPETPSGGADAAMEDDATASAEAPADGDAMDTSKDGEKEDKPKKKKKYSKTALAPETDYGFVMTSDEFKAAYEKEVEMANQDRVVEETQALKNDLETYMYFVRDQLDADWKPFITEPDCEAFKKKIDTTTDWLFDDDYTKSQYVEKITELRKIAAPIDSRKREADGRQQAVDTVRATIREYQEFYQAALVARQDFEHITDDELKTVADETTKAAEWINDAEAKQKEKATHEDPAFKLEECKAKIEALYKACHSIKTKPKPKKEEPKPEKKDEAKPAGDESMTDDASPAAPEKAAEADGAAKEAPAAAEAAAQQENGEVPMQD